MFYEIFVWQNALENTTSAKKLASVQTAALISICGALQITPTIAQDILLHIAPVDIAAKCMTAKFARRLREYGYLDDCKLGHSEIFAHFDFIPKYLGYHVAEHSTDCRCSAHIPSREAWEGSTRSKRERQAFL